MITISVKLVSVLIVSSVLWITAKPQHFCDSYNQSYGKFRTFTSDKTHGLLLIIGTDFWNVTDNGNKLSFENEDRLPNDTFSLGDEYSFGVDLEWDTDKNEENLFGFYNVFNELFVLKILNFYFNSKSVTEKFDVIKIKGSDVVKTVQKGLESNLNVSGISIAFLIDLQFTINGLITQSFDGQTYARSVSFKVVDIKPLEIEFLDPNPDDYLSIEFNHTMEVMNKYTNNQLIGVYVVKESHNVFGLFRVNSENSTAIKYCVSECKELKLLIDCPKRVREVTTTSISTESFPYDENIYLWIIILVTSVVLLLVLICLVVFCYLKSRSIETLRDSPNA